VIRAWATSGDGVIEVDAREAMRLASAQEAKVWIDFENEPEASVRELMEGLHVHPLVIEDMVMDVNRPKVDDYGDYVYLVIHSARWDEDQPALREIDVVLGQHCMFTHHDEATRSVDAAREVLPRRPELLTQGPARLMHFMLDVLVDHYLPIMDRVSEQMDQLEERLFDDRGALVPERIIRLKRGMSALRRIVGPQRDTMLALTRDEFRPIPPEMRPYLRDVYDRLARVSDLLDSFRDEVSSLLELHVSMVSNRLNVVIKRLTVIATIGLPLTVVTSYYGMNFAFVEYRWRFGWVYVLALLTAIAVATYWFLKRKRWL
jgi:magnesium transporter